MTDHVIEPRPGDPAHRVICQQVVELLTEFLEDALAPDARQDVQRHLDACPECRLFLDQLGLGIRLVGELPGADSLPEQTTRALVDQFRDLLHP